MRLSLNIKVKRINLCNFENKYSEIRSGAKLYNRLKNDNYIYGFLFKTGLFILLVVIKNY